MDRFSWTNGLLEIDETLVITQRGVRLYDGDDKAKMEVGVVLLSTHRLIWRDTKNHDYLDLATFSPADALLYDDTLRRRHPTSGL